MAICKRVQLSIWMVFITTVISCGSHEVNPDVLLFTGTGTSPNDIAAIKRVLENNHISYATATSSALSTMRPAQMMKYKLLIMPGGNFIEMGNNLSGATVSNIHDAVNHGLHYLGICAGAFLAGYSKYYHGFNFTGGTAFSFYSAENRGIRKSTVTITNPYGLVVDQYWEDGPQLSGWGLVVARYPDGTPAITERTFGKGFVMLTGIHAEAPVEWRRGMTFETPVDIDNAYAALLIRASINGTLLPHY